MRLKKTKMRLKEILPHVPGWLAMIQVVGPQYVDELRAILMHYQRE